MNLAKTCLEMFAVIAEFAEFIEKLGDYKKFWELFDKCFKLVIQIWGCVHQHEGIRRSFLICKGSHVSDLKNVDVSVIEEKPISSSLIVGTS